MKSAKWIALPAAGLGAAAVLWGYTILRVPARPREGKTRVACVGDSITYGCAIPLFFLRRYPAVLRRLLGEGFQVAAFAVNDRTLQDTGNKPFRRERAFRQSKDFRPDAVVILLGTNDSKNRNWISPEAFRQQYRSLIDEYRSLSDRPRVLICTPPRGFRPIGVPFYLTNDAMLDRIPEIAKEVERVAAETGAELVDLYALTKDRRGLFGPDGLHPTARGARAIAGAVFQALEKGA